jgi:hypothetical protein
MSKRPKTTIYMLKGVDPELWRKVRAKAAFEGRTIREVIVELLNWWVER